MTTISVRIRAMADPARALKYVIYFKPVQGESGEGPKILGLTAAQLREVGKRDEATLCGFLDRHAAVMPRTALRYSLEKLAPEKRKMYMVAKR
jgi:hypothetical protein